MLEVGRTELVWPGKYNDDGERKDLPRVHLPFQVIERVNESRASREARAEPSLFDVWQGDEGTTFEEGWRNKLIWGENSLVMGSLLESSAGTVDLIYIDPPFATGADFSFTAEVGDGDVRLPKEQSAIEEKAYRDTWGRGYETYFEMISQRLSIMRDLLSDTGSIYVHLEPSIGHAVKVVMDEIFGRQNFRNSIAWCYRGGGVPRQGFARKHDIILFYTKSDIFFYNPQFVPYSDASQKLVARRGGVSIDERPRDLERGAHMPDWWTDINSLQTWSPERVGFDTQKPEALLTRMIDSSSRPGDLVVDVFEGSGTTLTAAEKLGRRWIGCDLGRWAIHVTRKRLLDIPNCRPFEVLNLGKYERQYWQGVTFGEKERTLTERALYEYLAFILKLYGAEPVVGLVHLHGRRRGAVIHIGAVDAPVTIDEINAALDECIQVRQAELHVLGWEWEMGLAGPNNEYHKGGLMHDVAKGKGIKLFLLQIPREVMEEQAVAKGDVQFFELAYVGAGIQQAKKRTVTVKLTDFVIPNTELIPEDVREKIKKWSDFIDYWAVDWDFQNDTFMQGWVTYRTRRERALPLSSDPHTYESPGHHRIVVKVIDIFGNDTSQAYDVEVS